jgi:hypothetical protein
MIGWRLYLETATQTEPSYSEIVYDRAIKYAQPKGGYVEVDLGNPVRKLTPNGLGSGLASIAA